MPSGTPKQSIPKKTVYRMSIYYRALQRLRSNGIETVSSVALARAAGVKPAQLRKDFACIGHLGTRGLGYSVTALSEKLTHILGTARLQPVILVGAGHLGCALLGYGGFAREGFEVIAAFDADPSRDRPRDLGIQVLGMNQISEFIRQKNVKIAILTVPGPVAQEVANRLVSEGIQAILNFAPTILQVPEEVVVNNVDLAIELESLGYFIQGH